MSTTKNYNGLQKTFFILAYHILVNLFSTKKFLSDFLIEIFQKNGESASMSSIQVTFSKKTPLIAHSCDQRLAGYFFKEDAANLFLISYF